MESAEYQSEASQLRAELQELKASTRQLKIWLGVSLVLGSAALLAAGTMMWSGRSRTAGSRSQETKGAAVSSATEFGRIEMGTFPVELVNQGFTSGMVEFSKPFARRPLVFLCEAGHIGAFLVCKTDALSESNFIWAAGGIPVRRHYSSEVVWLAIEPKE